MTARTERPLVSVVVPAYNQGRFLAEAVTSALEQSLQPVEVIVVDDGSTDSTASVAGAFGTRVRYVRQQNQGLSAARNRAIALAQGRYVQLLDSDDALQPGALEKGWDLAEANPEVSVWRGGWDEVDIDGVTHVTTSTPSLPDDAFHALFDPMSVGPPCRYLVKRSAFERVGLFDVRMRACEDWHMWLRMAAVGLAFGDIPVSYARYRNYATSTSKDFSLMWAHGTAVLRGAAQVHGRCHKCREALAAGLARWREWCYLSMLVPKVSALQAEHDYVGAARECGRALRSDPALATKVARSLALKARRPQ